MARFLKILWILPVLVGMPVLSGCVSESSSRIQSPVEDTLRVSKNVVLDEMEPDRVSELDVINRSKKHVKRTGEIYMMRGLANVFSRGIDDMARQLRSRGYDAANFSYSQWQPIAADIARRAEKKKVSYPVIIIGHSLGGNESSKFANFLAARNVNVDLVVAFDPVETGNVGKGIKRVVNYYLPKNADNRILPASDFTGDIQNVDVSTDPEISHTNVDKNPAFQQATLDSISGLTSKVRTRAPRTEPGESR